MNYTAIIPAKINSRRLAKKNLELIGDKTLIEIAINYAKNSKKVNKVIVSTDSMRIKKFIDKMKICDCVMRNKSFTDDTEVFDVYKDALVKSGIDNGIVIGLQPDNPDRNIYLDKIINYFEKSKYDDLFSVGRDGFRNGGVRIFKYDLDTIKNAKIGTYLIDCTNIHTERDLDIAKSKLLLNENPLNLKKNKVFIIAEAACNHMCSLDLAKAMIDCAAEAGADAIKFQTYKGERVVTKYAPAFWGTETMKQTEYYKRLDKFNKNDYSILFDYAKKNNIIPFSTPFGIEDADMLNEIGMEIFKIPSFEIVHLELIEHIASFGKPIILSTGAATYEEIDKAIKIIISKGNPNIILMACTLSYHTKDKDANLRMIQTLKNTYPKIMIGMSDHTLPDKHMAIPAISAALGARIIEKHFTMSRKMTGSGHYFSLEPLDVKKMVENIRLFENVLGNGIIGTAKNEKKAKEGGRKSIVAKSIIRKGKILSRRMLTYKRPGTGISPDKINLILGKKTNKDIKEDFQIKLSDLEK